MKKAIYATFGLILMSCGTENILEPTLGMGNYSLREQHLLNGEMTINLEECLSSSDQMRGEDPNTLTITSPVTDSIYPGSTCMVVYKKGNCFIVDQGILGTSNCNPGTFSKRH